MVEVVGELEQQESPLARILTTAHGKYDASRAFVCRAVTRQCVGIPNGARNLGQGDTACLFY